MIDVDPYYSKLGKSSREWQEKYQKQVKEVMKMDFMKNIREKLEGEGEDPKRIKIKKKKK